MPDEASMLTIRVGPALLDAVGRVVLIVTGTSLASRSLLVVLVRVDPVSGTA